MVDYFFLNRCCPLSHTTNGTSAFPLLGSPRFNVTITLMVYSTRNFVSRLIEIVTHGHAPFVGTIVYNIRQLIALSVKLSLQFSNVIS